MHIPIVFTRKGSVEVEVIGSTMMQKDSDSLVIDVIPEVRPAEGRGKGEQTAGERNCI